MSYIPDPSKIPDWASSYGEIIKKQDQSMALLGSQVSRQGDQIRAAGAAKSQQLQTITNFIATVYKKGKQGSGGAGRQSKEELEYLNKLGSFKWDIDSQKDLENTSDYLQYEFETPWGPPEHICETLREKFEDVSITWFFDEPGMQFAGYL